MGLRDTAKSLLGRRGLVLEREFPADLSPEVVDTITRARAHSMTTVARLAAVCAAAQHVADTGIPGAFVESGVWRGGSSFAAALTLAKAGVLDRDFYLYDTFAGIPAPGPEDALIGSDHDSLMRWWTKENSGAERPWLEAPVEMVRATMESTGYPAQRLQLIPGLVQDTIPATAPEQIAFLRLDTDWYESTKLELEVLFPRLSPGGIVIIDDYGFTTGARKAVDEFLAQWPQPLFLNRIDSCGRLIVNPGGGR